MARQLDCPGGQAGETTLAIAVHRRGGGAEQLIALPPWLGHNPRAKVVYPFWGTADAVVLPGTAGPPVLKVRLEDEKSARLILVEA
ncbi:hypothetical protein ACW0JT_18890 [Arthrobacter sp. SA17]